MRGALRMRVRDRLFKLLLPCAALLAIAGCTEQMGDLRGSFAAPNGATTPEKISYGSLRGANVALASVEGAPAAVTARFSALFGDAAGAQQIAITDAARANYLVRGYLSAYAVEGGTAIGYVWDIFDAARHRTQRVSDAIILKASPADAWSLAEDQVLASLADKSVNDLSVFLAGTPEVQAASNAAVPLPVARPTQPLAYAPVE